MNTIPYKQLSLRALRKALRYAGKEAVSPGLEGSLGLWRGFESGALGGLVQGSQQVTALEEVQVSLQRHVDLTVVTGQLRQTGGLKRWAQQTTGYTWKKKGRNWIKISKMIELKQSNRQMLTQVILFWHREIVQSSFQAASTFKSAQLTLSFVRWHQVIRCVVAALLGKGFLARTTYPVSWILRLPVLLQRAET